MKGGWVLYEKENPVSVSLSHNTKFMFADQSIQASSKLPIRSQKKNCHCGNLYANAGDALADAMIRGLVTFRILYGFDPPITLTQLVCLSERLNYLPKATTQV